MKLFHVTTYDGESGYMIFADSPTEAKKILTDYLMRVEDTKPKKMKVEESREIKKGIAGYIDWTEPEMPLLGWDE